MSSIVIAGDTSGSVTLQAPAVSGSTVLNLPATSGTIQASGAGYTTNGVAYATSATGLVAGSALTFNGTTLGVITASGNSQLTLSNTTYQATVQLYGSTYGAAVNGDLLLYNNNGNGVTLMADNANGTIKFATGAGGSEGMRLNSTGLGIGTSSPATKLAVAGGIAGTAGLNISGSGWGVLPYVANSLVIDNNGGEARFFATGANATTDGSFLFYTSQTDGGANERARITAGGLFKASTTGAYAGGSSHEFRTGIDGNYALTVTNTASSPFGFYVGYTAAAPNNTTNRFIDCEDSSALRFQVRSNGGIANYSANNVNLSDRREKTNFAPATSYLDKICAIPVQTFNYIDQNMEDDGGLTLGVVAQDVQAVAPELVLESNWAKEGDEPKMRLSIYQTDLQYALMKCIQEQQALITQLTERITALEAN